MSALDREFGAWLTEARKSRGLTQEALAARAGMHQTTLSKIERGTQAAYLSQAALLSAALDFKEALDLDLAQLRAECIRVAEMASAWADRIQAVIHEREAS